jgi:hypothetical protein
MLNDAVLPEEAAGVNCQNLTFETVNATVLLKYPFSQTGYEADPALTGLAVYDCVPALSAVSKSQDIALFEDVACSDTFVAGVVDAALDPVNCAQLNVAAICHSS